jgi:hypothetical protein
MKITKILICTFALGCVASQMKAGGDGEGKSYNYESQQREAAYQACLKQKMLEDVACQNQKNSEDMAKQLVEQQKQIEQLKALVATLTKNN